MPQQSAPITVAALYKFAPLQDLEQLREGLTAVCLRNGVMGILLIAQEGINGTIAGSAAGIEAVLDAIRSIPGLANIEHKTSHADDMPFYRMKVRIKNEIVTMGVPDVDPNREVGTYVEPADWNELISDPDVVVIDTRNKYEVRIGTFEGAIDPEIDSFRELPAWIDARKGLANKPKIAMFCTGGIRCEKSTALMKAKGFDEVYHLKGGILKYLEEVPQEDSLWQGDCFVFDQRVAVGQGLAISDYELCYGCREPITKEDIASAHYIAGVCCPHCHDKQTPEQRRSFIERQKQIERAKARGKSHFGPQAMQRR